ncbi:MAG TPA: hypothetical protein VM821_05340 [Abditibacteriaceae bacterium]|jgi:hypothetical protein|nr:hypothetical protein [Abditibacteriaceae bacterium]
MQKVSKWAMCAGLSAIALTSLAGCNSGGGEGTDNGVSPAIQSPVMDKKDDQAIAGSDAGTGNSTTGSATTGNSASTSNSASTGGAMGGSTSGAGAGGGNAGSVPAPNTGR